MRHPPIQRARIVAPCDLHHILSGHSVWPFIVSMHERAIFLVLRGLFDPR
jgi:hypothetical protein